MTTPRALLSRWSVRARLTAFAAAGSAVVLVVGAVPVFLLLVSSIDRSVTSEIRVRVDDVADEIAQGEPIALDGALQAQVLTPDGGVLAPAGEPPLLDGDDLARAARGSLVEDRTIGGRALRVVARPAELADGAPAVVVAVGSTRPITDARSRVVLLVALGAPIAASAFALLAWAITGAALRPVGRMTQRAATISVGRRSGGPADRLPRPPGRDELAALGLTLNDMLDRIDASVAHERAFVDDASHELRTPLAIARGELELLRDELADRGEDTSGAVSALEEVDRLTRLAEDLLVLADAEASTPSHAAGSGADVAAALARTVERLDLTHTVDIRHDGARSVAALDERSLERILANLLTNADRFAERAIVVSVAADDRHPTDLTLTVTDDGPGFPDGIAARAFDRFVRDDAGRRAVHPPERGSGAGLGLAIVAAIVESAGGTVRIDPTAAGASVTVHLPRAGTVTPSRGHS